MQEKIQVMSDNVHLEKESDISDFSSYPPVSIIVPAYNEEKAISDRSKPSKL